MVKGSILRAFVLGTVLLAAALPPRAASAAPESRRPVTVLVPEMGNLQALAFWVALGTRYFEGEGLDVHVVAASAPSQIVSAFESGAAPVAVLPGNDYERLISDRFALLLVANLLQNDPHELVVRRDLVNRLHVPAGKSVRQRLNALKSVSIAVASRDQAKLYELFHSQGLDANLVQIHVRKPAAPASAFASGGVDGVYAATPTMEALLVGGDAIVYVDPAAGEIPELSERMIQALGVTRAFASANPGEVEAFVRGIAKAEHLIRFEPAVATRALHEAIPTLDPARAARVVSVYARAVPATPHVEGSLIKREARFYPVGGEPLALDGVDFESYVLRVAADAYGTDVAATRPRAAHASTTSPRAILTILGMLALAIVLLVVILDQREAPRAEDAGSSRAA